MAPLIAASEVRLGSDPQPQNPDYNLPFLRAASYVIDVLEGGGKLVKDDGGLTRWGIAQKYHPDVDVANLTREQALAIYKTQYWDWLKCGEFSVPVGSLLFDCGINPGCGAAIGFLQAELRVEQDGVIGPETIDAAARVPQGELLSSLSQRRISYYVAQTQRYPYKLQWLPGWIRRAVRMAIWTGRLVVVP